MRRLSSQSWTADTEFIAWSRLLEIAAWRKQIWGPKAKHKRTHCFLHRNNWLYSLFFFSAKNGTSNCMIIKNEIAPQPRIIEAFFSSMFRFLNQNFRGLKTRIAWCFALHVSTFFYFYQSTVDNQGDKLEPGSCFDSWLQDPAVVSIRIAPPQCFFFRTLKIILIFLRANKAIWPLNDQSSIDYCSAWISGEHDCSLRRNRYVHR